MSNKYLVKLASLGIISNIVKPVLSIGKGIIKDIGTSAHKAIGGGFRDAAVAKGVTNQSILRGISDPRSFLKATKPKDLPLASHIKGDTRSISTKGSRKNEINNLIADRKKSIMKTVGYGGAAIYGGNKILDKIKERNEQQQYYQ